MYSAFELGRMVVTRTRGQVDARTVRGFLLTTPPAHMLASTEASEEAEAGMLSSWALAHFCSEEMRTMLRNSWFRARKQQCRNPLLRYVRTRPRRREHRESGQRVWLQSRYCQFMASSPRLWDLSMGS